MKTSKKTKLWVITIMIFILTSMSAMLAFPITVNAAPPLTILHNGSPVSFDQPAIIRNNRVMVPFRALFELMDAEVDWDPRTQQIFGRTDTQTITLTVGNSQAIINGEQHFMDAPPFIVPETGRTLVPIRFIGEALGADVFWDPVGRRVCINT